MVLVPNKSLSFAPLYALQMDIAFSDKLQQVLQETIKAILSDPTGSKNVDATTLASLEDAIGLMLEEASLPHLDTLDK